MIRLGIAGAGGRMGRALVQAAHGHDQLRLVSASARPGSALLGVDAGQDAGLRPLDVPIRDTLDDALDLLIDFTNPAASLAHVEWCRRRGIRMVIGTTGFNSAQLELIRQAAADIAMVLAPNMSVGVNLCLRLVELAARTIGATSDIEIVEAHHRHKADAPSGTALRFGETIAAALGRDLDDLAVYARHGQTGARPDGAIGFATVRAGDIVGEHTVLFATPGERIEITHKAGSRANFANGALRAAAWLADREPGLYEMQDVLGLAPTGHETRPGA